MWPAIPGRTRRPQVLALLPRPAGTKWSHSNYERDRGQSSRQKVPQTRLAIQSRNRRWFQQSWLEGDPIDNERLLWKCIPIPWKKKDYHRRRLRQPEDLIATRQWPLPKSCPITSYFRRTTTRILEVNWKVSRSYRNHLLLLFRQTCTSGSERSTIH